MMKKSKRKFLLLPLVMIVAMVLILWLLTIGSLFADEESIPVTYTVTVASAVGGTATVEASPDTDVADGTEVAVSISDIESGKQFASIAVEGDGTSDPISTVEVTEGEQYTFVMPAEDVTVTVTLEAVIDITLEAALDTYTVTFIGNCGTPEEKTEEVEEGGKVDPLPTVTWANYDFVEWNTEFYGTGDEFDETTEVTEDITVYAQWKAVKPTPVGDKILYAPWDVMYLPKVYDLTKGDLTLSYTIDMRGLYQPGTYNTFKSWQTWYTEVGLRGEGASNFNPGPFGVYQGKCGGWMVSDSDNWVDSDGFTERGDLPCETQDLDDKHALQASGGRSELDYDVLDSNWNTVLSPFGSHNNHGIWFDRDGVDQWQADDWGNLGPGGVGSGDGLRYNTNGIYDIVITYHAIDDGLGVMFATVNGYPQGFYTTWINGEPQNYPAGLSFKGDMKHMLVFAGLWAPSDPAGHDYGWVGLSNIRIEGSAGESDPLVADFTYAHGPGTDFDIQFTNTTHGGYPERSYTWDFGDGNTSTDENPSHTYSAKGEYTVKLTADPARCVPQSITKTIIVEKEKEYCRIGVLKVDGNGDPLTGAGFTLYNSDKSSVVRAEKMVDVAGKVAFDKLPMGTYVVSETTTPGGYRGMEDKTVIIDAGNINSVINVTAENTKSPPPPEEEVQEPVEQEVEVLAFTGYNTIYYIIGFAMVMMGVLGSLFLRRRLRRVEK
jgi:PKD repeat protein